MNKTAAHETKVQVIPWRRRIRYVAAGLLITLGCLAIGTFAIIHWAEKQILNTDNWVALVSPIPKDKSVSTALGTYISDQLFDSASVQAKVSDALPPRASFLAGPLTDQLHTATTKASQKLVASDAFQTVWVGANRTAINRIVLTSRGQTPPLQSRINEKFNLNLGGSSGQLSSALGKAATAVPALQPASKKVVNVTADLHAKADRVRGVVRTIDFLSATLPWLITACLLWALVLSRHRRRTVMTIAVVAVVILLLELIALKVARQSVMDQVKNPANLSAVSYIYDVLTGSLKRSLGNTIAVVLLVFVICLFAGPQKWASAARSYVRLDKLKGSRPFVEWRKFRRLIAPYQYYVWLGITMIVLVCMALFWDINSRVLVNSILATLSIFALVKIVSTPPDQTARN